MNGELYIVYNADNDSMGDTPAEDCNAFRGWAFAQLTAEYPNHDIIISDEPSGREVTTNDNEHRDGIEVFCRLLWERCPWDFSRLFEVTADRGTGEWMSVNEVGEMSWSAYLEQVDDDNTHWDHADRIVSINGKEVLHEGPNAIIKMTFAANPRATERSMSTNTERAHRAREAIKTYLKRSKTDDETAVCDLIVDLGHLCDAEGEDFEGTVRTALAHWKEEREE